MTAGTRLASLSLLAFASAVSAEAAFIRLRIAADAHVTSNRTTIGVFVTNEGDEPAFSVAASVSAEGRSAASSETSERLDTGRTFRTRIALDGPLSPPGIHTAIIRIRYTDANGYPFTAIATLPAVSGDPGPAVDPMTVGLCAAPSGRSGEVLLTIASELTGAVPAHVSLVLPDELSCPRPEISILVPPREKQMCRFAVSNVSGWPGSAYEIFAVVDYDWDGRHHSVTARSIMRLKPFGAPKGPIRKMAGVAACLLAACFVLLQFKSVRRALPSALASVWLPRPVGIAATAALFASLAGFTLAHLSPEFLAADTTTVGGDTPAHNYMASQLARNIFERGRLVCWANGWWCGFPLFQFYFLPPYIAVALLSKIMPFNLAFKWISISGILALPPAAAMAARIMGASGPAPFLAGTAMLLLLFDSAHTMWGVNIFSTLAGMIANSVSFPIMLLALACAARDAWQNRFRAVTSVLLALLAISHFFTTVVAAVTLAAAPLMAPRGMKIRAMLVLAAEGALAFLLAAWWVLPLAAGMEFTVPFGENWDISLQSPFLKTVLIAGPPLALAGLIEGAMLSDRFVLIHAWMFLSSALLFWQGWRISGVFVNIRLWPFMVYALLAIAAGLVGRIARKARAKGLLVSASAVAAMLAVSDNAAAVAGWARWNYRGLELSPRWPVIRDLILPLDGTPGRLANDLHERNNSLGSTRIFECVPHLIRKPVVEGGILTSSPGSLYAYYLQSETSKACAGFPTLVTPTTFNMTNATLHMELLNVKHFIACWEETSRALAALPQWKKIGERDGWELFELTSHDGKYVVLPRRYPAAVRVTDWKKAGLEWFARPNALEQPFIFLRDNEPDPRFPKPLTQDEFMRALDNPSGLSAAETGPNGNIEAESVADDRIAFTTRAVGMPHLIKINYHPNWKVRGASRIYLATPCFMIVYPDQENVELRYGYSPADIAGMILAVAGVSVLAVLGIAAIRRHLSMPPAGAGVQQP